MIFTLLKFILFTISIALFYENCGVIFIILYIYEDTLRYVRNNLNFREVEYSTHNYENAQDKIHMKELV